MKTNILILFVFVAGFIKAQTNYLIEYDKLTDRVTYYKQTWVHGEQMEEEVKTIRLEQNDIVSVYATNVNTFVFDATMLMTGIKAPDNSGSPVAMILSGFSGFGGPALQLLTGLASHPPSPVMETRGDAAEEVAIRKKYAAIVSDMHSNLLSITKAYSEYEKNVKVKYDKTLTQDEIGTKLQALLDQSESVDVEAVYENLVSQRELLEELKNSEELSFDDPTWEDISNIEQKLDEFEWSYVNEEGELRNADLTQDLIDVENSDFAVYHTFLAKSLKEYGGAYASNEFIIVFKEIKGEDSEQYPIDYIKRFSIPVKQPNTPYWSLGVNAVMPIGGVVDFAVKEIVGDSYSYIPDSLEISENSAGSTLLSIGTAMAFDIPTEKALIPNVQIGASIAGINKSQENWNISLLLGGGLSFRQFPFLSVNAGFSFTQMRVLKDEYITDRPFVKPDTIEYDDYSPLFKKSFKPGLYFGVGIRL
jgi:hypothetical protein